MSGKRVRDHVTGDHGMPGRRKMRLKKRKPSKAQLQTQNTIQSASAVEPRQVAAEQTFSCLIRPESCTSHTSQNLYNLLAVGLMLFGTTSSDTVIHQ